MTCTNLCDCSRRTKACGFTGFCCCCVHVAVIALTTVYFTGMLTGLKDDMKDLMWIDDTTDTSFDGPLEGDASEKKQYEDWKRTPEQLYEACLATEGLGPKDCPDPGISYALSVFNVTNPDAFALGLEKPKLQQVGPIFTRILRYVEDVNTSKWNAEGIALFQENFTVKLDTNMCDSKCLETLDAVVVVANPFWAAVSGSSMDALILFSVVIGGLKQQFPSPADWNHVGHLVFGLDAGTESEAFAAAFLNPGLVEAQTNLGGFLMSTHGALTNQSPICLLGLHHLPIAKCLKVMEAFQVMLKAVWPVMQSMLGEAYGGAASMPVFVRATVRQVIGLDGAGFTEPLLQIPGMNMGVALNKVAPAKHQMAKKFGAQGVDYNVKQDCLQDPDCGEVCESSSTCTPTLKYGYTSKLPGRVWDATGAFPEYSQVGTDTTFYSAFTDSALLIKSGGVQTKPAGDLELSYVDWKLKRLNRRTENCAGNVSQGSMGHDCGSPLGALHVPVSLGPGLTLPLYVTWAMFKKDYMDSEDFVALQEGQLSVPYDPEERVSFEKCHGNAWCGDPEKMKFLIRSEPESGVLMGLNTHMQVTLRIGTRPTLLHNFNDTLLPVATMNAFATAPPKVEEMMARIQGVPDMLNFIWMWCVIEGAIGVLISCCCMGKATRSFLKNRAESNAVIKVSN